jgi:hypothetical protein
MISKLPATYAAPVEWVQRGVKFIAATLIEAILILGFVVLSLGLGAEGHAGVGPDRPPPPVTPASEPAPGPVLIAR